MSVTYLLDTNACIRLLNRTSPTLRDRCRQTPRSRLRLCSIVKFELSIGGCDLLIAATALAFEATLVTPNVSEFSRVRGLKIQDWELTPAD